MAYSLEAILVNECTKAPDGLLSIALADGIRLVPIEPINQAMLGRRFGEDSKASVPGLISLTTNVQRLGADLSSGRRSAYVHAEFFGGPGFQAAVGWENEQVAFSPCLTANHPSEMMTEDYSVVGLQDMAINRAL